MIVSPGGHRSFALRYGEGPAAALDLTSWRSLPESMPRVPIVSLGFLVVLLGAALAVATLFRPPASTQAHILPAGSTKDETLVLTLSSPVWHRSGVAEEVVLVLRREGSRESPDVWLAAAELHAGGAVVAPPARREGPLRSGDQVAYRWSVEGNAPGLIPMEISVRVRWDEAGEEEILWADRSRPQVRDYLGMDAVLARTAGMTASLIGGLTSIIGRRAKPG